MVRFDFYAGGKCYKVGHTEDLNTRFQQINSLLPGHLLLVHAIKAESKENVEWFWHERFDEQRIPGTNEWFDLDQKHVAEFVETTEMRFEPEGLQFKEDPDRTRRYQRERRKADELSPGG